MILYIHTYCISNITIIYEATLYSANSYNIRYIGELLFQLLVQALKYHPCNVSWLRLMGDLNFGARFVTIQITWNVICAQRTIIVIFS